MGDRQIATECKVDPNLVSKRAIMYLIKSMDAKLTKMHSRGCSCEMDDWGEIRTGTGHGKRVLNVLNGLMALVSYLALIGRANHSLTIRIHYCTMAWRTGRSTMHSLLIVVDIMLVCLRIRWKENKHVNQNSRLPQNGLSLTVLKTAGHHIRIIEVCVWNIEHWITGTALL